VGYSVPEVWKFITPPTFLIASFVTETTSCTYLSSTSSTKFVTHYSCRKRKDESIMSHQSSNNNRADPPDSGRLSVRHGHGNRRIGLASGVVRELGPVETIRAAAAGGWDMVGLWVDPDSWTDATTADVHAALVETGLSVIDVEVIWIQPGPLNPAHLRILDVGVAVGAANALVVSSDPDASATAEKFAALCAHVAGTPLRVALEFGLFSEVKTIHAANTMLDAVNHPSAALLVDTLHLVRSGSTAADVEATPRHRLTYAQICDAPASGPDTSDASAMLEEARWDRLQVGEGALDVAGMIAALPPGIPLSVELRSRALEQAWPDPTARSQITAEVTRAFLERL
jgi:sugar phosphate isomerase/epimerase